MRARFKPSKAASHQLDLELAFFEIQSIKIGDLELATSGWAEFTRESNRAAIVKIEARDRVAGLGVCRLLFDRFGTAVLIKRNNAVGRWIPNMIAKDGCAPGASAGARQQFGKTVAVEDVVAQYER